MHSCKEGDCVRNDIKSDARTIITSFLLINLLFSFLAGNTKPARPRLPHEYQNNAYDASETSNGDTGIATPVTNTEVNIQVGDENYNTQDKTTDQQ